MPCLLNKPQNRDRLAFVENNATFRNLQAQELGNADPFETASRTGQPTDARIRPQFALYGKIYERRDAKTSYYYCTFQLTDLNTSREVWSDSYEVRTLN